MDHIPYVGQLEHTNVPIEGWIIDHDVHGHLDGSCNVMCLHTHNEEVVNPGVMTCDIGMVIDGGPGGVPWAFLQRSLQITLCTPHHTPACHTYTCVLQHSSL